VGSRASGSRPLAKAARTGIEECTFHDAFRPHTAAQLRFDTHVRENTHDGLGSDRPGRRPLTEIATRPGTQPFESIGTTAHLPRDRAGVVALQRLAGNRAVGTLLSQSGRLSVQRDPPRNDDDDEAPRDRSRRARPRNAPSGTVPIDQSGLDRETIHKIKDAIGAAPDTWVGVTPDGHIVTGDSDGNIEDHGHISDYARSGSESIPKWVWGLLAFAAVIALIVLFATGVGEVAVILAGAGVAVTAAVMAVLRAVGRDPGATGPIASADSSDSDASTASDEVVS
jgi:hypothetical protein